MQGPWALGLGVYWKVRAGSASVEEPWLQLCDCGFCWRNGGQGGALGGQTESFMLRDSERLALKEMFACTFALVCCCYDVPVAPQPTEAVKVCCAGGCGRRHGERSERSRCPR